MARKRRLGTDPWALDWIRDTRKGEGKQVLHGKGTSDQKSTEKGLPSGWVRATFIVRRSHVDKLKALAYWDRRSIKELVEAALASYLKGKRVKSIPKGHRKP